MNDRVFGERANQGGVDLLGYIFIASKKDTPNIF